MGNHIHAVQDFLSAIRINDHSALAYFYMGVSKLEQNKIREAIEHFS
jgi:tetratricopeptide (TPR) repeat protein